MSRVPDLIPFCKEHGLVSEACGVGWAHAEGWGVGRGGGQPGVDRLPTAPLLSAEGSECGCALHRIELSHPCFLAVQVLTSIADLTAYIKSDLGGKVPGK